MTAGMILAAGFGTRLGALSDERPKPLLPVLDVPLVRWAVALLAGAGIRDVVVNLHHLGHLLEEELGDGASMGVRIRYSREERILGTGGGIRRALPLLGDGPFVVVNGKILIDLDLRAVLARHRASGAAATLVVRPDAEARRWGAIDAPDDGGRVRGLLGDGPFMFTGVHVLEPSLVARLPDDGEPRCIVREGYVPWLREGVPIEAHVARGYFMEHSTPARLLAGNLAVLRGEAHVPTPPLPLGAGVEPGAVVDPGATIVPPVRVRPGARIGAGAVVGPDVIVGTGATVAAGVKLRRALVFAGANAQVDAEDAIVARHGVHQAR